METSGGYGIAGSNIVLSKYARDAQVAQAEFVKSSVRTEDSLADGLTEFALVGRSTVGKSSLLNSLCCGLVGATLGKGQIIPYLRRPWAQAGLLLRTTPMRIVEYYLGLSSNIPIVEDPLLGKHISEKNIRKFVSSTGKTQLLTIFESVTVGSWWICLDILSSVLAHWLAMEEDSTELAPPSCIWVNIEQPPSPGCRPATKELPENPRNSQHNFDLMMLVIAFCLSTAVEMAQVSTQTRMPCQQKLVSLSVVLAFGAIVVAKYASSKLPSLSGVLEHVGAFFAATAFMFFVTLSAPLSQGDLLVHLCRLFALHLLLQSSSCRVNSDQCLKKGD
ncbi:hypothetical protein RJ639_025792 [Escallonia herrerae]|uniref:G domain-containing protein n=1 Tax=Escallonia herrerae TaxID=1293975 RepID=A0AA88UYS5_9ASTE|nr:hypothetical protein RJ639_025792 [Escallonia herrerae]